MSPKRPSQPRTQVASTTTRHERTRRDHRNETAEDYVEAVAEILEQQNACRVVDLAEYFGVSHVTVSKTVKRLVGEGLMQSPPYRPIELTAAGRKLAQVTRKRHDIIYQFLIAIGISKRVATIDSEGMEHHVSQETLDCFEAFIKANAGHPNTIPSSSPPSSGSRSAKRSRIRSPSGKPN